MICAILLLFLIFYSKKADKVEAYIYAVITWTLLMFGITEIMSVFRAVTMGGLWLAWGIPDVILFIICLQGHMFKCKIIKVTEIPKSVICIVLFLAGVLFLAVKTIPYNWDSMTYHLGRIVHWHQNRSVSHYATGSSRQVACPVLSEFINLNVYTMLNGNDCFLNLLQCFSYFTNGWLVYHITRKLGAGFKYCILACILFFSMPIAFAEALTTQTDNFSAMYALMVVYLLLDFCNVKKNLVYNRASAVKVIVMGFGVSFSYLAKPSVGIGLVFFALWLLIVSVLRRDSVMVILKLIVTAVPGMIIVMIPESYRNLLTFHALIASGASSGQLIGSLHERYVAVNFIKNFSFNMPCVWLHDSSLLIEQYVRRFANWLGIDISNVAISGSGRPYVVYAAQTYGHDTAVNPVIVWLFLVTVVMLLMMCYRVRRAQLVSVKAGYYLSSAIAFLAFCTVLKWSPWRSRYMIVYLALLCPAIVLVIEWFVGNLRQRTAIESGLIGIIIFCILTDVIGMFCYHGKIAFAQYDERAEGYFAARAYSYQTYQDIAEFVNDKNYLDIGLLVGGDAYEYAVWKMIDTYDRIEHVNVEDGTRIYEDMEFVPDVILVMDRKISDDSIECHGYKYEMIKQCDDYTGIYEKIQP